MSPTSNPCDTAHLLLTNIAPSPLEAASLQHEIDDLTASITHARAQLDAMEMNLRKRQAALSPIRRMPPEVIAQIIRYVAWGVLHSRGRHDLVGLTLVCKSWRNAALLCHEQWAGIHIEPDEIREPGAFDKILSWYGRAGNLPKTLEFHLGFNRDCYCGEDSEEVEEDLEEVKCKFLHPTLTRLLAEGPTLHRFLLRVTKPSCFRNLLKAIRAIGSPTATARPWDTIRWLEIDFSDPDVAFWDDEVDPAESFFNYLPQVTTLSLCMPSSYATFEEDSSAARAMPLHVPPSLLHNLTSFTIDCDWEGNHVLSMLQHCLNVERLGLCLGGNNVLHDTVGDVLTEQASTSRLLLPRLRTLHLNNLGTAGILNYLKTPMLRDLQLGFVHRHEEPPQPVDSDFRKTLEHFVKASNCENTIRSLELKKAVIQPKELADAIVGLASLKRLAFDDMTFVLKKVLVALTKRVEEGNESGEPCLPHLEDLELADVPLEIGVGPVSGLVKSLLSPKLRLTVVYTIFARGKTQEGTATEAEFLADICRSGVSVRVIPDERLDWWFKSDDTDRASSEDA